MPDTLPQWHGETEQQGQCVCRRADVGVPWEREIVEFDPTTKPGGEIEAITPGNRATEHTRRAAGAPVDVGQLAADGAIPAVDHGIIETNAKRDTHRRPAALVDARQIEPRLERDFPPDREDGE